MWPLDPSRGGDIVRVGAHAVELWRGSSRGLAMVASEPAPRRGSMYDASAVAEPLHALAARIERARASVVLESAFAPVLLADTGGLLTNDQQVEALLRHRFGLAYGGEGADVSTWKLRTGYRFGDRFALGFALAPVVESLLSEVGQKSKIAFTAWSPALSWSLDRFSPWRRWPQRSGWWVWPEQDRSLLVFFRGGRAEVLNPASPGSDAVRGIEQAIAIEQIRASLDVGDRPIGVARWHAGDRPQGVSDRIRWFPVESMEMAALRAPARKTQDLRAATP